MMKKIRGRFWKDSMLTAYIYRQSQAFATGSPKTKVVPIPFSLMT